MTITSTVNKIEYTGDGSTIEWPITFPITGVSSDEILVYKVDSDDLATLITTGYEVNLTAATPIVTYPTVASLLPELEADEKILIVRSLDLIQETDYKNQGSLPAETIELGLDRLTMIIQQINEELGRCAKVPINEDEPDFDTLYAALTAATSSMQSATASFDDGDLVAGVYTFNHALGTKHLQIAVYDNNDKQVTPDEITATDINNISIDLSSYGSISGTWNVRGSK